MSTIPTTPEVSNFLLELIKSDDIEAGFIPAVSEVRRGQRSLSPHVEKLVSLLTEKAQEFEGTTVAYGPIYADSELLSTMRIKATDEAEYRNKLKNNIKGSTAKAVFVMLHGRSPRVGSDEDAALSSDIRKRISVTPQTDGKAFRILVDYTDRFNTES